MGRHRYKQNMNKHLIKLVLSLSIIGMISFLGQISFVHANTLTNQESYSARQNMLINSYKKAYDFVQTEGVNNLKNKFHLIPEKYNNQNDYLNEVTKFYNDYDPQLGIDHFLEEIIVQQLLDKEQNPNDWDAISSAWQAYFMYDAGFDRNGKIFQMMGPQPLPDPGNTTKRTIQVTEEATGKSIKLNAFYLDQNSDTTIVATGGFRGNGWDVNSPEVQLLKSFGYNILMTEPRSSGTSEGTYISLGYYEKDDYTAWINNEVNLHPTQKIYLYGGSMGGAVVMGAVNNNLPANVKGIVEVAGFASIDQELTSLYNGISKAMGIGFSWLLDFNPNQREATFNILNDKLLLPKLKIPLQSSLPLNGVEKSVLPKLFIHGDSDNIVPYTNAYTLFNNSAGTNNNIAIIPGATHGGDIFTGKMGEMTKNAMTSFFNSINSKDQVVK